MTQKQMEYLYSLALMLVAELAGGRHEVELRRLLLYEKGGRLDRLWTALSAITGPPKNNVATLFQAVCRHHGLIFPEYFNQPANFEEYTLCHNLN